MLMILGAIQGLVFVIVTLSYKKFKSRTNYILAFLILCFSLVNIQYFLSMTGIVSKDKFFGIVYIPFACLNMVTYYFYVKSYLYPEHIFTNKEKALFIPFILFFIAICYYKVVYVFGFMTSEIITFFRYLAGLHEVIGCLFSLILLGFTIRLILKFKKDQTKNADLDKLKQSITWLLVTSSISFLLCIIWAFAVYKEVVEQVANPNAFYYFLWISMSFTIYWLGHIGLYKYGVIEEQKQIKIFQKEQPTIVRKKSFENENINRFQKLIVDEKKYLDSNLSLEKVADDLHLNSSHLSRLINAELKVSFSDYINSLRVEEAKSYMKNLEFSNYTLVAIGLEAGFNSKSAFQKSFKKFTGITPSEYKKSSLSEKLD